MIDPKIKEAWRWAKRQSTHGDNIYVHRVMDWAVQAEARARMTNWKLKRGPSGTDSCDFWTLADWAAEVRAELEKL